MQNEPLLIQTLVELADSLVDDFDVVDLLTLLSTRCVQVLDVSAAGILLVAAEGDLRIVASSSETMRVVELFEVQSEEGPCVDCYRTGTPTACPDLEDAAQWPHFAPMAIASGFRAAHAVPMRLRGAVIGAMNLFRVEPGELAPQDWIAGQALADVATIAILQHRAGLAAHELNMQLNEALSSRIAIEQAKGVIAERAGIDTEEAFNRLREYARSHNLLLANVASDVTNGTLAVNAFGGIRALRSLARDPDAE
jgi:GAF domain-containing protein